MSLCGRPRGGGARYCLYRVQAGEPDEAEPTLLAEGDTLAEVLEYQQQHFGPYAAPVRRPTLLEVFDWEQGVSVFWHRTGLIPGPPA